MGSREDELSNNASAFHKMAETLDIEILALLERTAPALDPFVPLSDAEESVGARAFCLKCRTRAGLVPFNVKITLCNKDDDDGTLRFDSIHAAVPPPLQSELAGLLGSHSVRASPAALFRGMAAYGRAHEQRAAALASVCAQYPTAAVCPLGQRGGVLHFLPALAGLPHLFEFKLTWTLMCGDDGSFQSHVRFLPAFSSAALKAAGSHAQTLRLLVDEFCNVDSADWNTDRLQELCTLALV